MRSRSILLVNSVPKFRNALMKSLLLDGYEVKVAKNGFEALDITKNEPVDLIVTDFYMPDMDAIELAVNIREFNMEVPIVVVVRGEISESEKRAFENTGGFVYLRMPADPRELKTEIDRLLLALLNKHC